jgi:hypothetical protein
VGVVGSRQALGCDPIEQRLSDAREMLSRISASTPLDTMPTVVPSIWFRTNKPDIEIPARLLKDYPTDMSIILENRYRDLTVTEKSITVTVSFQGTWETLVIPWNDVIKISDGKSGRDVDLRACP